MLGLAALFLIAAALLGVALPRLLSALQRGDAGGLQGARRLLFAGALLAYLLPAIAYLVLLGDPKALSANWLPGLLFFLPGGVAVASLSVLLSKALQQIRRIDRQRAASSSAMGVADVKWRAHIERQNAVAELTAAVAHGVRNPLASIRAAAQIAREINQEPEVSEILHGVLRESDRLEQRIRNLVDFSKPLALSEGNIDLQETLRDTLSAAARRANDQNVILEQECPASLAKLRCDPEQLENALFELVSNGLTAMPEGGRLLLSVEGGPGTRSLRISDTGSGIPEGVRDRLFDLFFTTRPDSAGMGLATVRKIARGLQGEVRLETSGPDGSVFCIDLPDRGGMSDPGPS